MIYGPWYTCPNLSITPSAASDWFWPLIKTPSSNFGFQLAFPFFLLHSLSTAFLFIIENALYNLVSKSSIPDVSLLNYGITFTKMLVFLAPNLIPTENSPSNWGPSCLAIPQYEEAVPPIFFVMVATVNSAEFRQLSNNSFTEIALWMPNGQKSGDDIMFFQFLQPYRWTKLTAVIRKYNS